MDRRPWRQVFRDDGGSPGAAAIQLGAGGTTEHLYPGQATAKSRTPITKSRDSPNTRWHSLASPKARLVSPPCGTTSIRAMRPRIVPDWDEELEDNIAHPTFHLHVNYHISERANDVRLALGEYLPMLVLANFGAWTYLRQVVVCECCIDFRGRKVHLSELIISVSGLRGIVGDTLTPEVAASYVTALAATATGRYSQGAIAGHQAGCCRWPSRRRPALGRTTIDAGIVATPTAGVLLRRYQAAGASHDHRQATTPCPTTG